MGRLYFRANDGVHGTELVITDGTVTSLWDLNTGPSDSNPGNFTVVGDKVFFTAFTAGTGTEVFVIDGTGQPRAIDLLPGPASSTPTLLTAFGNKLAYVATDGTRGIELVVTDGTTTSVWDINAGPDGSSPANLLVAGGNLFLTAVTPGTGFEVFVTDGNSPPRAIDVLPGVNSSTPAQLTVFGNKLAYVASDGTHGIELVVTDGITTSIWDINAASASSSPANLLVAGDNLFLTAFTPGTGTEVFVTDGTGPPRVIDVLPGSVSSGPDTFTVFGSRLAYVATDGARGAELVLTDGTTTNVWDINTGPVGSSPSNLVVAGNRLFFTAFTAGTGTEVFVTDGISQPRAIDVRPGALSSAPNLLTAFGDRLAFVADDGTRGAEIVVTDGTTTNVLDVGTGPGSSLPSALTPIGTQLFFTASTAGTGTEVFVTDGTGQPRAIDILPGALSSLPNLLTAVPAQATYSIAATGASKAEGAAGTTPLTFTVSRTGDLLGAATLTYTVAGSGARPADAADFTTPLGGTVSFAAGETSRLITLGARGDTVIEPDEGFAVTIAGSPVTKIAQAAASGLIFNDDFPPSYAIDATDAFRAEGSSRTTSFTFLVSRLGASLPADTLTYLVIGSGAHPADATDFTTLPSGTVSFAAGETSSLITIGVRGDDVVESPEGFTMVLQGSASATAVRPTATGTILNDDRPVAGPGQLGLLGTHDQYAVHLTGSGRSVVTDLVTGRDGVQDGSSNTFLFSDGTGVPDPTGTGAQVYRLYQAAFDRVADLAGQTYWTRSIDVDHQSLDSVAENFTRSAEFLSQYGNLSNGQVVHQYYRNVLGREGESTGVDYWTAQLDAGASRGKVLLGFSESIENIRNTVGVAGDADYGEAYRLYAAAFARMPDQPGLDYWTQSLAGGATPLEVARNFTLSREFHAIYDGASKAAIVDKLYLNVLGRPAEAEGRAYWTAELNRGTPVENVLLGFADSDENRAHTAAQTHDGWVFIG